MNIFRKLIRRKQIIVNQLLTAGIHLENNTNLCEY